MTREADWLIGFTSLFRISDDRQPTTWRPVWLIYRRRSPSIEVFCVCPGCDMGPLVKSYKRGELTRRAFVTSRVGMWLDSARRRSAPGFPADLSLTGSDCVTVRSRDMVDRRVERDVTSVEEHCLRFVWTRTATATARGPKFARTVLRTAAELFTVRICRHGAASRRR